MVSDGTEGARRLPDEAFASHARRPDPSRDEHVAFPEHPTSHPPVTGSLPESAWTGRSHPRPAELPPELAHIPPEVIAALTSRAARQRSRSGARGRLSPAGLGLAIVVALALILGSNGSTQPSSSSTGIDQGLGHEETVNGLELTPMPSVEISGVQSIDQPTYEFPSGPSVVRIEVVSDDPAADIVVTSDIGDAEVPGEALPFAAELNLGERAEQLAVTALARYGDGTIQCRLYADGQLVAINTGDGLVECVAEPAR